MSLSQEWPVLATDAGQQRARERYLSLSAQGAEALRRELAGRELGEERLQFSIASVLSLSTQDFPGRLAAVVYSGDHGDCARQPARYSWRAVEYFLSRWRHTLSAVAFSGHEPTAQAGLSAALGRCRDLGFATALHTCGSHRERLASVLPQLDWVSLQLSLDAAGLAAAMPAIEDLRAAGAAFECRTRLRGRELDGSRRLLEGATALVKAGVRNFAVCHPAGEGEALAPLLEELNALFPCFSAREEH